MKNYKYKRLEENLGDEAPYLNEDLMQSTRPRQARLIAKDEYEEMREKQEQEQENENARMAEKAKKAREKKIREDHLARFKQHKIEREMREVMAKKIRREARKKANIGKGHLNLFESMVVMDYLLYKKLN